MDSQAYLSDYNICEYRKPFGERGRWMSLLLKHHKYKESNAIAEADFNELVERSKQGDSTALYLLGDCYRDGTGVDVDLGVAVDLYSWGAELGDAGSQYSLGDCYAHGIGVDVDIDRAVYWMTKAAEQDYRTAKYDLAKWCNESS